MHEMTKHYLICALWASTDESNAQGGNPLDDNYTIEDFSVEALERAEQDCMFFLRQNPELIKINYQQAGHDFWLTRNHHGAGFWDRKNIWGELGSDVLTSNAHIMGELHVYVGDDNKLYFE